MRSVPPAPRALSENGVVEGLICACSIGTLDYLLTKALGSDASRRHLATLSEILTVAGVSSDVIAAALGLGWPDLEDAIVHEGARLAEGDAVVTRDRSKFTRAGLRVYTPAELLAAVDGT